MTFYVNGTKKQKVASNVANCRDMLLIVVTFVANCRDIFFPSPSRRPLLVLPNDQDFLAKNPATHMVMSGKFKWGLSKWGLKVLVHNCPGLPTIVVIL